MRKRITALALRSVLAAACACTLALAQPAGPRAENPLLARYQANFTTTGAGKVTVQATTTSGGVSFEEVDVYCVAAQTATVYVNGTAATTTTLAMVGPIGVAAATPPAAFSASNVGTGTTLKVYNIPAGGTLALDLRAFFLPAGAGGAANFTVGTSGTCTIQIQMVVAP